MALTSNTRGMIGKGTVRLRRRDGTEEPFELGNVVTLEESISTDSKSRINYQSAGGGELDKQEKVTAYGLKITADDFKPQNLALALRASASLMASAAVSAGAVRGVLGFLGFPARSAAASVAVDAVGGVVGAVLNIGLFVVLFRVVAKIDADRDLVWGCVVGGLGVSVMQLLGTRLLAGASRNPLLAPFATLIGVLIWFNLVSQLMLAIAAGIAEAQSRRAVFRVSEHVASEPAVSEHVRDR